MVVLGIVVGWPLVFCFFFISLLEVIERLGRLSPRERGLLSTLSSAFSSESSKFSSESSKFSLESSKFSSESLAFLSESSAFSLRLLSALSSA